MKQVDQRRVLMVDNQDYRAYVELTALTDSVDRKTYHLKFKTLELVNSEPMQEEVKFEMFLADEDLARLKSIL
jgi:hypothetical protein